MERLEPRVVLGSLVPTETGTFVGGLLPLETVDLLSLAERTQLTPGDRALLETEQTISELKAWFRQNEQSDEVSVTQQTARLDQNNMSEEFAAHEDDTHRTEPREQSSYSFEFNAESDEGDINEITETVFDGELGLWFEAGQSWTSASDMKTDTDAKDTDNSDDADSRSKNNESTESKRDGDERRRDNEKSSRGGGRQMTFGANLTFASGGTPLETHASGYSTASSPAMNSVAATSKRIAPDAAADAKSSDGGSTSTATGSASQSSVADSTNATGRQQSAQAQNVSQSEPVVVNYDFRDLDGARNEITQSEQVATEHALRNWEQATNSKIRFERNSDAANEEVVIIFKGPLETVGFESAPGEVLGVGGAVNVETYDGRAVDQRVILVDGSDSFDTRIGNGDPAGTFDFSTIVGHEMGHILGLHDAAAGRSSDIMNPVYDAERGLDTYEDAASHVDPVALSRGENGLSGLHSMITGFPQLSAAEVGSILNYATTVTPSEDAIIAIVDRGGNILGVRVEDGVISSFDSVTNATTSGNGDGMITPGTGEESTLVFAIDGAVAKARTAAFFANGDPINGTLAPITSRLVRFISQSTVSYREVNSNPNSADPMLRGPGFVAPIGLGGHFPPEVMFTPPVDLFAIEHTNRDSSVHPGEDGVIGTTDDIDLMSRFNVDPIHIPLDTDGDGDIDNPDTDMDGLANSRINSPDSYGFQSGIMPAAQGRGIATLPGGVPLFRDTDGNGVGETLIGGIGVFFPGDDGTAVFEQAFVEGIGQSESARTNAPKVLEAEFIALVAAGGSVQANIKATGAKPPVHPVADLDIPFGRLDLVGIQLQAIGPTAGIRGVRQLLATGSSLGPLTGSVNGENQFVNPGVDGMPGGGDDVLFLDGESVPFGWLVTPHDGGDFDGVPGPDLTAAQVTTIITQGITEAERVRAAIRLPLGSRTRMVFSVTDKSGEVLGLYRMRDATFFSIDVAVAKARNTAYYADSDPGVFQTEDAVVGSEGPVPLGAAFTNRTYRFLSEPRYPSGQENTEPGDFSILHDLSAATGVPNVLDRDKVKLVESTMPIPVTAFDSVLGHDAFFPQTNFHDLGDGVIRSGDPATDAKRHQNGIVFFPGSTPLYDSSGVLIGGFGVSGDGVDQDDVVTFSGAQGFLPPDVVIRADEVFVDGTRLPFQKFLRNPRG